MRLSELIVNYTIGLDEAVCISTRLYVHVRFNPLCVILCYINASRYSRITAEQSGVVG